MKRTLIIAAMLAMANTAHACKDSMEFAPDKQKHFAGSVVMGAAFNAFTDDPWKAFAASLAVGALVEARDAQMEKTGHCASWQDFAYDAAGSAIGAYAGFKIKGLIITPRKVTYNVAINIL